ncbi:MAG: SPOR domain-containing protein [Bacteroidales bacterium]|nr:SPOR domain-containing protein [Bacteroidales bacterium]
MRSIVTIILIALLSSAVASQDKSINVITQPSWPPGTYVPVRIEIINSGLNDFARFYQDLPQGFSVRKGNSSGADFYWENNQVNFVWVKMPQDKIIRISYLAMADEALTGSFRLGGKLDYVIEGKDRKSVEFNPLVIRLDKNAIVEENLDEFFQEETHENNIIQTDTVVPAVQQKIEFRVQVAILSQHVTQAEIEHRINCRLKYGVTILKTGNMYKYQSGAFKTYSEASDYLEELKGKGVNDVFIVAYRGNEQIPVTLARTLTQ